MTRYPDRHGTDGRPRVAHVATVDITHRFLLLGQLLRLRDAGFDVTAVSAPGPYAVDLEAHGIRHVTWTNATRAWNPRADAHAFVELVRILRHGRYDIVHTHNPKPGVIGRLASRVARVPIVVNTVHGFYATPDDPFARRSVVLAMERMAARFSDLELFQSREDLEWARRAGVVSRTRARYLGNGIDLSTFDPSTLSQKRLADLRHELGIPQGATVVGTVGRMVAEKGFREFFEAARDVRRRHPNVYFLAVGDIDREKPDVIALRDIAAATDVVFTGWRDDLPALLGLMDVFVLASWREGMPRSAIEAAAMGCALVLTNIRGCREIVSNGEDGLLVPPRDANALADAITRLTSDPSLRADLAAAARRRAVESFDERTVFETITGSYQELLSANGFTGTPLGLEGLTSVRIRTARRHDVHAIARLHAEVLPLAFLPTLGQSFLRRLFGAMVDDGDATVVVAERAGTVIGYAAGVTSMPAFRRRFLRRHGVAAALTIAPRVVRPRVLSRVVETMRYPELTDGLPEAEWTFVGVKRGTAPGLGPKLGRHVLDELTQKGVEEVKGYVARDNRAMNAMVTRMGFELRSGVSLHDGRPSNVYVIRCRSSSPSLSLSS
jgi:glycosyltransferase involved in cell wall biosynthesis/L-amino acid N-acyltransferase YncA